MNCFCLHTIVLSWRNSDERAPCRRQVSEIPGEQEETNYFLSFLHNLEPQTPTPLKASWNAGIEDIDHTVLLVFAALVIRVSSKQNTSSFFIISDKI